MTDETIGTVEAHEVILERCPTGCGNWKRATLPMKWEQDVEHGFAIPIVGCGNPWHYTNLAAAPMTDETTRLRDALLDARYELSGVLYPYTSTMPDDVHLKYAKALDALIKAAAAEARAGLVGVEAVREAAHWLERSQREQNVHQFRHGMALLRAALAGPTPSPAVERVVGAVFCPCLPSGGWVCEECGAPVESEPCPDHMDPEGVMTYRPGVPCPDRRTPTPEPTDG